MTLQDQIAKAPDIVSREVGSETVLLDLAAGTYFGLNAVGGRVWDMLGSGAQSLAAICDALEHEFDVTRAELEADVLALAADLQANGLVTAA